MPTDKSIKGQKRHRKLLRKQKSMSSKSTRLIRTLCLLLLCFCRIYRIINCLFNNR